MMDSGPSRSCRARLAIVIPAFGRGEAIAASVAGMVAEARACRLDIVFHVSDDTGDDSVEHALAPLIAASLPVRYRRNRPALRHDRNVIASLVWPEADYVWPIGSNHRARAGMLASIVAFLDGQDLVFVNNHADHQPCVAATGTDAARRLICEMLWHQTMTGTTIYARRVCEWVAARGEQLMLVPNFPQICTILGFAAANEVSVGWFAAPGLQPSGSNDFSYWRAKAIDVFAQDWADAVAAFPDMIPAADRARVTREHSRQTQLFNTSTLMDLRVNGQFRWASLADRRVRDAMHLPAWKLVLLLLLPLPLLRLGSRGLAAIKRRRC